MLKKIFSLKQQLFSLSHFLVILDYWVLYALRWCSWDSACMVKSTWLEEFLDKFWYFADSLKTLKMCIKRFAAGKSHFWQNDCHFNFTIYVYPYVCLSVCIVCLYWFGRLRGSIWDQSGIWVDTKLKVYRSVVLPTLLYGCETWTVYQQHAKRLNHFHTSCLRKLLKIKWQDKIPDTEVLKRAGMQSVHTLLKLAQLRWTGHFTRMPDERLPKKILYGEHKLENGPMVVRRSDTRTLSKPP